MKSWQRLQHNYKYGLLGQSILLRLTKIGLDLMPYYLYRERIEHASPKFPDQKFRLERITAEKIDHIADNFPDERRIWRKTWKRRLSDGEIGLLLKHGDKIAGFTWANLDACSGTSGHTLFELKCNEAYLHDMVIAKDYRGSNLAMLLRIASYEELKRLNRDTCYSISACFNKPANKFKKKLNAERIELRCEVTLFRRMRRDFRIRRFSDKLLTG